MKRLILAILALGVSFAYAQSPVITQPLGVSSYDRSGSIAITNTFQSVMAASTNITGRTGCTVQNNGSNSMFVFFGVIASAITPDSVKLAPGQSVMCSTGVTVIKDQVSITGTSGEQFFAAEQ